MDNNIGKYSINNRQEAQELLNNSRIKIDEIDNKLFELICDRTSLAQEIAIAKHYLGMNIYDNTREKIIQNKIHKLAEDMKMGNIRTSFVKRLAKELVESHPGIFTNNFDENKKLVMEYSTVSTKHLRNKIAGYVTRLIRLERTHE